MITSLSEQSIKQIYLSPLLESDSPYIVQIIKLKDFGREKKKVRYRISISDGQYSILALVSHSLIQQMCCELKLYDILRIQGYVKEKVKLNTILKISAKPECLYTGLREAIGLGNGIKNINSIDDNSLKFSKEIVDVHIPSYRKLKEIIRKHSPVKKPKVDFFKEMKEGKLSKGKSSVGKLSNSNEETHDSEYSYLNRIQYSAKNWKIKVRITKRNQVINFNSCKGAGSILNIELIDSYGNQILGVFFNKALNKFDGLLKEKRVYIMSGGKIQLSHKSTHSTIDNKYCINFPPEASIKEIIDDNSIPMLNYNFTSFNKIHLTRDGSFIDIIGVVHSMNTPMTFHKNDGRSQTKRQITVVDESGILMQVCFWGDFKFFESLEDNLHQVIVVKQAKVKTYGGSKSLNCFENVEVQLEPEIQRADEVSKWFEENLKKDLEAKEKRIKQYKNDSKSADKKPKDDTYLIKELLSSLDAVQEFSDGKIKCSMSNELFDTTESFRNPRQPQVCYITVSGFIESLSYEKIENTIYLSCPKQDCKRKVFERDGKYKCEACREIYNKCNVKYALTVKVADPTGRVLVQFYDECAERVIGRRAAMIKEFLDKQEFTKIRDIYKRCRFKPFTFTLKLRQSSYRQESRVQAIAYKLREVNYQHSNSEIIKRINMYLAPPSEST
ncbi:unnamed protein product [Moneuplotes crassus]|uniref:Replication protein A subunit n=1 Tax=Euplotes crassus TaxID=5936 RepID=A0AAD1U588_EUPCR|nr:unnamed protein product [Moneuplotes crassus]